MQTKMISKVLLLTLLLWTIIGCSDEDYYSSYKNQDEDKTRETVSDLKKYFELNISQLNLVFGNNAEESLRETIHEDKDGNMRKSSSYLPTML